MIASIGEESEVHDSGEVTPRRRNILGKAWRGRCRAGMDILASESRGDDRFLKKNRGRKREFSLFLMSSSYSVKYEAKSLV